MEREAKRKVRIGAIFRRNAEYMYRRAAEVSLLCILRIPKKWIFGGSPARYERGGAGIRIRLSRVR